MKKLKNLITCPAVRYPLLIILSIFIGISSYALNASNLLGNRFPMPFGYGFSTILTGSMEPYLAAGDLVVIKEQESYVVGDVVAYQSGNIGIVHRLIQIDGDIAITKGDANNAEDEAISLASIRGKIIYSVPMIGNWIIHLKSPVSIFVMILFAIFLVELSFRTNNEKNDTEAEQLKSEIRKLMNELELDNGRNPHKPEGGNDCEEL